LEVAIKTQKKTENLLAEAEEEQDGATEKLQLLEIRVIKNLTLPSWSLFMNVSVVSWQSIQL
jgi:hypothetical protein